MEKRYCVIGDPIAHSLSPAIYTQLFASYGLTGSIYTRELVTKETLPGFISTIPEHHICGFNITMPLKEAVLPYLNYQDSSVVYGANTVVVEDTVGLAGYSTDAQGFERSLALHGRSFAGAVVVFIGCGGAAQTLIRAASGKATSIVVINRTPAHAAALAALPGVTVRSFADLKGSMDSCSLLINATPLGMHGFAADFADLSFLGQLPKNAFVCDLIYSPPQTSFLKEAARLGHDTMNGLWMLIWQAFYAFEKYTGILPDMDAFAAVRKVLPAPQ